MKAERTEQKQSTTEQGCQVFVLWLSGQKKMKRNENYYGLYRRISKSWFLTSKIFNFEVMKLTQRRIRDSAFGFGNSAKNSARRTVKFFSALSHEILPISQNSAPSDNPAPTTSEAKQKISWSNTYKLACKFLHNGEAKQWTRARPGTAGSQSSETPD